MADYESNSAANIAYSDEFLSSSSDKRFLLQIFDHRDRLPVLRCSYPSKKKPLGTDSCRSGFVYFHCIYNKLYRKLRKYLYEKSEIGDNQQLDGKIADCRRFLEHNRRQSPTVADF
uniref:Uncharacterized protein n=1 Tax=Romanomermis culicivorax TaxID=13658 RepID=A0A915KXN5_ROMCU